MGIPEIPEGLADLPEGLSDLTDPERNLLAHLTVLTLLPQMQRINPAAGYTYERMSDALGDLAAAGDVKLIGNTTDVWVVIRGRSIVHAARDWLAWSAFGMERADSVN